MRNSSVSFDDHCEFAIQFLLARKGRARQLAVALARRDPDRSALEVVFILSLAVSSIEDMLAGAETTAIVIDAWRVAALVGVDLHMMKTRGMPHSSCADLLHYWETVDRYFLT